MNDNKTNVSEAELNDKELDAAAGGYSSLEYMAKGNMKTPGHICWQCGWEFEYAPGLNMGNADDPWRHFCSPECKKKYDTRYMSLNPRG